MEKRTLVCPNCRSRLTVADQPGIEDKNLACPKCKFKAKVSVFMTGAASMGGHGADSEATRLPDDPTFPPHPVHRDPGQFRIVQTGQFVPLHPGFQTIGRLASERRADIQIGSDTFIDPFMSRLHVKIEVVNTPSGLQHRLYEIGSRNIIKVNGQPINPGDVIVLRIGDKITLGKTDFILQDTDNEATQVAL